MSIFYKMDPAAWNDGTAALTLEEEAAYLRIVNTINLHDGPVPNVDRVLAGMFRVSTRKARSLRDRLIAVGKITVEGGFIWNDRARLEVKSRSVHREKQAEKGAKGGRTTAERNAKALKDKESDAAPAQARREEKRREKEEPKGSSKKGSRLSPDWVLTKAWGDEAMRIGLSEAGARKQAERFKDYWISLPGQKAVKTDWMAVWRNWCRKHVEDQAARSGVSENSPDGAVRYGGIRMPKKHPRPLEAATC